MADGQPVSVADFEELARSRLAPSLRAYLEGAAGGGQTVHENSVAPSRWKLMPRVLRRVDDEPGLRVSLFGDSYEHPIMLAPTSPLGLFHPRADLEVAEGAHASDAVMIASTDGQVAFPRLAAECAAPLWFQLYAYESRTTTERLLEMAVSSGARAIVVTLDARFPARRNAVMRSAFAPPPDLELANLRELGVYEGPLPASARFERLPLHEREIAWIREAVSVPLIAKGVLHPDDAEICLGAGFDGVIVSNHGGRQQDGAIAALDALVAVRRRVPASVPILVDGGIRTGADVAKALALGASAICIGRPYLWGLIADGRRGVERVVATLKEELLDSLRQLGAASVGSLGRDYIYRASSPCRDEELQHVTA